MLLVKMIRIAFILKDLELGQFFKDKESVDVSALVDHLEKVDPAIVIHIARIASGDYNINDEVDAVSALTLFFWNLKEQMITSPHLRALIFKAFSTSSVDQMMPVEK